MSKFLQRYYRKGNVPSFTAVRGVFFSIIALVIASIAAWGTHVIWIIGKLASDQGATAGQMVLGVLGAVVPPIGIIHGLMIWLGVGF